MKTVIITGASDGLGKAIAQKCVDDGMKVVNISRSKCPVGGVDNILCDLSIEKDIENAVAEIKKKYLKFDVLINNAAIVGYSKINEIDYEKFEKTWKVNTIAPLYIISRLFDLIVENEADVINIGTTHSQHAHPGIENQLAYVATKYGLRGGSYNISMELKKTKSRLVHVYMGGFQSKMHEKDYGNVMTDPENWMKPSELAELIIYLINLPKQIEISEITVNRKGRRG